MAKSKVLIRVRSPQERMRRHLLLIGIPLISAGLTVIWYLNHITGHTTSAVTPAQTPIQTVATLLPSSTETPPSLLAPEGSNTQTEKSTPTAVETPTENNTIIEANANVNTDTAVPVAATLTIPVEPTTTPTDQLASESNPANGEPSSAATSPSPIKITTSDMDNIPVELPANFDSIAEARSVVASIPKDTLVSQQVVDRLAGAASDHEANTNSPPQPEMITQTEERPTIVASNPSTKPSNNEDGAWIYAGQFTDGAWIKRGLKIDNELPLAGQNYQLAWGTTVRSALPAKSANNGGNLGQSVGFINQGKSVQVLTVHNSGRSGHIWLKIKQ